MRDRIPRECAHILLTLRSDEARRAVLSKTSLECDHRRSMCRNSEIRTRQSAVGTAHHGLMPLLSRAQLRDGQRSARSNFQKKTRLRAAPLLDGEAAVCLFGVCRRGPNLGVKTPFDLGISVVELPGIEPVSLPGQMPSEMRLRYVSFQFVPAEYLQVSVRLLTPSRGITTLPAHQVHLASPRSTAANALRERARFAAPSCS